MRDLLEALVAKMTRRHPHVFGDRPVGSAAEALAQWEAIKDSREQLPRSTLSGVPRALPGLSRAPRPAQGRTRRLRLAGCRGGPREGAGGAGRGHRGLAPGRRARSGDEVGTCSSPSSTSRGSRTWIRGRAAGDRRPVRPALRDDGGSGPD
jgi:hypothetical protein